MIFWYITWTNLMIRNTHNNIQTVHTVKILKAENSATIVLIMAHYICSPVCHNTVWNDGIPPMIHLKMIYRHHCRLTKEQLSNFFHNIGKKTCVYLFCNSIDCVIQLIWDNDYKINMEISNKAPFIDCSDFALLAYSFFSYSLIHFHM